MLQRATTTNDDGARVHAVAEQFLEAWSSHDPARVLACYTEDVEYRDPNLASAIRGTAALDRYLRQLFAGWRMQWQLEQTLPLAAGDGAAVMWHAQFHRVESDRVVKIDGMDLVVLRGSKIRQNYVFFDRAALAQLGVGATPTGRDADEGRTPVG